MCKTGGTVGVEFREFDFEHKNSCKPKSLLFIHSSSKKTFSRLHISVNIFFVHFWTSSSVFIMDQTNFYISAMGLSQKIEGLFKPYALGCTGQPCLMQVPKS